MYRPPGPPSPSTWITTPTPTASAQPLPLEGSAWLVSTAQRAAPSPFPALLGFTAVPQVRTHPSERGRAGTGGV